MPEAVVTFDRIPPQNLEAEISGLGGGLPAPPPPPTAAHHARIVKDKALLYALIQKGTAVVSRAYADTDNVDEVLDWAEQQIFELSQDKISRSFVPVQGVLYGTF